MNRLVDSYCRIIDYLRISVTDRCNFSCKYCINESVDYVPHCEILSYEEIIRFVKIVAGMGIEKIRITGGEPLLRKGIVNFIKEITSIKGITDVGLTTNGFFLGDMVAELKEAGLKRINISLDTMKQDRFTYITGVDALDTVMENIIKADMFGFMPIKINTVLINGFNNDEIIDFVEYAKSQNYYVRFIEFMPFGDFFPWKDSNIITSKQAEKIIKSAYNLIPSVNGKTGPAKMFDIEGGPGKIGFIGSVSNHICAECNRIRLTPRGTIRPCLFSETEYDLKCLLRNRNSDEEIIDFVKNVVIKKPKKKDDMKKELKYGTSLKSIGG